MERLVNAEQLPQVDSLTFLRAVFAEHTGGFVHLFALDHATGQRQTLWQHVDGLSALADAAAQLTHCDVWFGPATRGADLGMRRGGSADCVSIGAIWLDIDIAGPNHAAPGLPTTMDDAYVLLRRFPLAPSIVVETGGGLQPWWLLNELLDADAATSFLTRWGATWAQLAQRHGWHIDNVFDLARVMRLPATFNHKNGQSQPVGIVEWQPTRRYTADDLDQWMIEAPVDPTEAQRSVPYVGSERPGDAYNASADLCALVEQLGAVLDHETGGDVHYRAPHHQRRGETGVTVYADGHVTVYSETFAAAHGLVVRRPYDAFGLFTFALHGGDWVAATRALTDYGWGTNGPTRPPWDDTSVSVDDEWLPLAIAECAAAILAGELEPNVPTVLAVDGGLPLFYPGRVNSLFGESGSGKTWIALAAAAECLRRGQRVLMVDWEDNVRGVAERLINIGLTVDDVRLVDYINPTTGLLTGLARLRKLSGPFGLVVLDSTGEAMAAAGVDSNDDSDVARWFALVKLLCLLPGHPPVLLPDHVPKSSEAPTAYAIGSQRKRAAITGASYRVDAIKEPGKGIDGLLKLTVAKDRLGNRAKGAVAAMCAFGSIDDSVVLTFTVSGQEAAEMAGEVFRPTTLMERVSRYVEFNPRVSTNTIVESVKGKRAGVLAAVVALVDGGFVTREEGQRGAHLHSAARPFRADDPFETVDRFPVPTGSRLVPGTSAGSGSQDRFPVPSPTGGNRSGEPLTGSRTEVDQSRLVPDVGMPW